MPCILTHCWGWMQDAGSCGLSYGMRRALHAMRAASHIAGLTSAPADKRTRCGSRCRMFASTVRGRLLRLLGAACAHAAAGGGAGAAAPRACGRAARRTGCAGQVVGAGCVAAHAGAPAQHVWMCSGARGSWQGVWNARAACICSYLGALRGVLAHGAAASLRSRARM